MEMLDNIVNMAWITSLAVLLITMLIGLFGGLKRGALRAGVKLLTLVISVGLSLVITLLLRNLLKDIAMGFVPEKMQDYAELIELAVQTAVAMVLVIVFLLVLTVVRLVMILPHKLISRKLPRTFAQAMEASHEHKMKKAASAAITERATATEAPAMAMPESVEPSDGIAVDESAEEIGYIADAGNEMIVDSVSDEGVSTAWAGDGTEALGGDNVMAAPPQEELVTGAIIPEEPLKPEHTGWKKTLWYASAALCGMLSSVLVLGVAIMPLAGFVTRAGDAVSRVTEVMEEENIGGEYVKFGGYLDALAGSPLFAVTDFFYGNTVFEPLTSFHTPYGKINLSDEFENATDILCDLIPVAAHIANGDGLQDGDEELLADAAEQVADSKFLMSVGAVSIQSAADSIDKIGKKNSQGKTVGEQAFDEALAEVMEDMTPDALEEDVRSIVDLVVVMADSPLLRNLLDEDKKNDQPEFADLADREMICGAFDVVYENDHAKILLVPMLNLMTEKMFEGMDVEPVYSDADLSDLSRDEMQAEANRLCDAMEGLSAFVESVNDGQDVTQYRMAEAGKALDSLKASVLFGEQYEPMVRSVAAMGNKDDGDLVSSLADALVNGGSAENLMNAAESVVVLGEELEKGEKKGSENEKLVSSLDTLLNQTEEENTEALRGIAGDAFAGEGSTEEKNKIIGYFAESIDSVSKVENLDIAAEADAVQVMYDLAHSEQGKMFAQISETEMVDCLLKSNMALSVMGKANGDQENFNVHEKMTDAERANVLEAIENADSQYNDVKGIVATFFGFIWTK